MPRFVDLDQLTPDQQRQLPAARACYDAVVARLAQEQRGGLHALLPPRPGDKSALFARLLEGRPALSAPPPTHHSYPWYEAVEAEGPWEVWPERWTEDSVEIGQCRWQLLKRRSRDVAVLSYPGWRERGLRWELSREWLPAAQAHAGLIAAHNPSLGRLTTVTELARHVRHVVDRRFDPIRLALGVPLRAATLPGVDLRRSADRDGGAAALAGRRGAGLPDLPTEDELAPLIARELDALLSSERDGLAYQVQDDGSLAVRVWLLRRLGDAPTAQLLYLEAAPVAATAPQA